MLLGLDWVESMMYLFFACHLFILFFMHMYPFFSLHLFWVVIPCFCFSPSRSLSDRLRMEPKCKSTPSRNHLRSKTSSDPTPTHIRFCDEKAHKDFSENFSKHGIHLECHVILSNFSDTALPSFIHTQGWESLCEIPVSCPIVVLQEL